MIWGRNLNEAMLLNFLYIYYLRRALEVGVKRGKGKKNF